MNKDTASKEHYYKSQVSSENLGKIISDSQAQTVSSQVGVEDEVLTGIKMDGIDRKSVV